MPFPFCNPAAITAPSIPGINVLNLYASPVIGYNISQNPIPNFGVFTPGTVDFCNVTVTYKHVNKDDTLNVEVWLPSKWNERILAVGGGGLAAGRMDEFYAPMGGVVDRGYATFTTDGGLASPYPPENWVLKRPGVLNHLNLENWGTVSLNDMAKIGKDVVKKYYGKSAKYSYFSGCSQGGRQGYELAQSFPNSFDGILATAPAIRLHELLMNWVWPQLHMNLAKSWPRGCEVDSITSLQIEKCDTQDGIKDGILSDPHKCKFDAFSVVGQPAVDCSAGVISQSAAYVANITWAGIWDKKGKPVFFAPLPGTDLIGKKSGAGIAATTCYDSETSCAGAPLPLAPWWVSVFALRNPSYDLNSLTLEVFYDILKNGTDVFDQYVGTNNPDLRAFSKAGGKMMTYHGLADMTIPSGITRDYYKRSQHVDSKVSNYFRYFEVPALGHCLGNGHPDTIFDALRTWVEKGKRPDSLPISLKDLQGSVNKRIVCPYPQTARYNLKCGNPKAAECFTCN